MKDEEKLKPLPYHIFSRKIKARRIELGLSLRETSEGIMSVSYLNDMEQGHRKPAKGEKIVALAKVLKLDVKELLEMSGLIDEVKGWIEYAGLTRPAEKLVSLDEVKLRKTFNEVWCGHGFAGDRFKIQEAIELLMDRFASVPVVPEVEERLINALRKVRDAINLRVRTVEDMDKLLKINLPMIEDAIAAFDKAVKEVNDGRN